MKKSRFSDQQIAFILQQAEKETTCEEVCRKGASAKRGIHLTQEVQKYGGLMPSRMKRLKQLDEENQRRKILVADLSLDKEMLPDCRRIVRSVRKRQMVSIRCGCRRSSG
jgi:putative transposase